LSDQVQLNRATLDRIQIGDVAVVDRERLTIRPGDRDGIAGGPLHQSRLEGLVLGAPTGHRLHRLAAGEIENGDE
jgi:hypothetical protein